MDKVPVSRETKFSPCRKYRYTLWREWQPPTTELLCAPATHPSQQHIATHAEYLNIIALNPSTADARKDDPTIRRCIGFAKRWGFGAFCMTNLFAWRDKSPAEMKKAEFPEGMENDHYIRWIASNAGRVVVAWGNDGKYRCQDINVLQKLRECSVQPWCLGKTGAGCPKHPLYVLADTVLIPFQL